MRRNPIGAVCLLLYVRAACSAVEKGGVALVVWIVALVVWIVAVVVGVVAQVV